MILIILLAGVHPPVFIPADVHLKKHLFQAG